MLSIALILSTSICSSQNRISEDTTSLKSYHNPIDQNTYRSEGGFKVYKGGKEVNPNDMPKNNITGLSEVVLLSSDDDFKKSITVEELQSIITRATEIFDEHFGKSEKAGYIMVQFDLGKKKNQIQLALRDNIDLEIMAQFEKVIKKEKFAKSKSKPLKFQLIFRVSSKDCELEKVSNKNEQPIVMLDGKIVSFEELEKIKPDDVDEIEVIKDKNKIKEITQQEGDHLIIIRMKTTKGTSNK